MPAEEAGADPDSQGNGSLMRILPIAMVDPPHDAAELIDRSSAITHGAPECLAACAVYVLVARRLADGERDRPSALASAFADVEADYRSRGGGSSRTPVHHDQAASSRPCSVSYNSRSSAGYSATAG